MRFITLLLITIGLLTTAVHATTAYMCADRQIMINVLKEKHGESQEAIAMGRTELVEIWANRETGSWTILSTNADNKSCISGNGGNYMATFKAKDKPNL